MSRDEKHIPKTNPMRILEQQNIGFEVLQYKYDEENLDAVHAAGEMGLPCEQVFKTIVMRNNENKIFVFCVPSNSSVNLKKARAITFSSEITPVKPSELLNLTGYIRGGCSPVGMKKPFPTYFHSTATGFPAIYVSAGVRGLQFRINPEDLISYTKASVADIIK